MALQSSGAISISQINTEVTAINSNSLTDLSTSVGKTAPHAMSEFYGYAATHNVSIDFHYPNYVGCYSYVTFYAVASEAVNATLGVTMYWYGDLGGAFQGTVYIGVGTTCGSNSSIYTSATNCSGEYFNDYNYYFSTSTSGDQAYIGNTYYLNLVPC